MPRDISTNAREQVHSSEIQDVILVALDIEHPDLDTIHVVDNTQSILWGATVYQASSFKFKPPQQEEGELRTASITLSNVDRNIVAAIRAINSSPTITANILFVGDTVEREAGPWEFDLYEVSYNSHSITGTLSYNLKPKQTLSTLRMTYHDFPGLILGA